MINFHRILIISPLFGIALSGILLTACSKEKEELVEPDYSILHKLKKVIIEGRNSLHIDYYLTYNYEYDSAGRIVRYVYTTPGGNDTTTYIYTDSTLVTSIRRGAYNTNPLISVFNLNSDGLAITKNEITNKIIHRYSYDEDTHCVLKRSFSYGVDTSDISLPGLTETYLYINGNKVKYTHNGYLEEFSYYKDKINTLGNYNIGMTFMGKSSKNLQKVEDVTDAFDEENRLIKRTSQNYNNYEAYEYY